MIVVVDLCCVVGVERERWGYECCEVFGDGWVVLM